MTLLPVLLVHGFASSFQRNWVDTGWVDLLGEEGREVIGLDLPGHGTADKPHDPDSYGDLPGAVLDALPPIGSVDAVGFSLGATFLLEAALRCPERFESLVIGGVGDSIFSDRSAEVFARAVETGTAADDDPPAAQAFARFSTAPGNDPLALAACLRRPRAAIARSALSALSMPVLVVIGDRDFSGPAGSLVDALGNGQLVELPGVDHFATPKDFRFIDAALRFFEAADR